MDMLRCSNCGADTTPGPSHCPQCGASLKTAAAVRIVGATESEPICRTRVVVTDVDMPFGSMVVFMVKWGIAAIPAVLILTVVWFIVAAMFAGAFASL